MDFYYIGDPDEGCVYFYMSTLSKKLKKKLKNIFDDEAEEIDEEEQKMLLKDEGHMFKYVINININKTHEFDTFMTNHGFKLLKPWWANFQN
jgi:hypothetical protein